MTSLPKNERRPFEIGIYSFAELTPDPHTGEMISSAQRMKDLLESIELADKVGLDVFGLGRTSSSLTLFPQRQPPFWQRRRHAPNIFG